MWLAVAAVLAAAVAAVVVKRSARGQAPPPLPPLTAEQREISARLRAHVEHLASSIGERSFYDAAALERAAVYVEAQMRAGGDEPAAQVFVAGHDEVRNVEAVRPGAERAQEIVVVGAHYDTVTGSPGADDNASGVAALLEIARLLRGRPHARTLRLLAFVLEEPPCFQSEEMGSLRYARRCRARGEDVVSMVSLESIAYYSDAPHSQTYPAGMGLVYPSTGNFVGIVGDLHSRALVNQVAGSVRRHTAVPCVAAALPGFLPGVGWSDQWAFWETGYRAVMVTDTAPFRNPAYHTPGDTPETLDYDRTARVVAALAEAVSELLRPE